MDFTQNVVDATCEIFDTMLLIEVVPGEVRKNRPNVFTNGISGIVGMAGGYRGMLAIHCSDQVAMAITGAFLGMEVTSIDDDVKDAMGEMANMLAGGIKTSLAELGRDINLSIPSAISGPEYTLECPKNDLAVIVPFKMLAGEFLVELHLQEQTAA